tara:strand:+ start:23052 stop:23783 length:732 start_codon:yes stop_codon:yes gene_type:complete
MENNFNQYNAIILAAGLGTRMGENYKSRPKCLAKVNKESLLKRHIRILKSCGINKIIVVVGKKGDCWNEESFSKIKKISEKLVYNDKNKKTNNSYSLLLGLNKLSKNNTIVVDGDLFYSTSFMKNILENNDNTLVVTKASSDDHDNNKVETYRDLVKKIGRNISLDSTSLIYLGVIFINYRLLNTFNKILKKEIYFESELSSPLTEIAKKKKVFNYTSSDFCININSKLDLKKAENWLSKNEK